MISKSTHTLTHEGDEKIEFKFVKIGKEFLQKVKSTQMFIDKLTSKDENGKNDKFFTDYRINLMNIEKNNNSCSNHSL